MNRDTAKTLINLEYSRYASWLPKMNLKGLLTSISAILAVLAGMLYLFSEQTDPTFLFTGGAFAMIAIGVYSAGFEVLSFSAREDRDWWLTIPHSRTLLVYAKFVSLVKFIGRMGVYASIIFLLLYLCMVQMGKTEAWELLELASMLGATVIFAAVAAPVAIAIGLMLSLMYQGWAKWVLFFPSLIVLGAGPLVMFFVMTDVGTLDASWFSPVRLLVYAVIILIVGFPLTYVILKAVGRKGLQYVAEMGPYVVSNQSTSNNDASVKRRQSYGSGFAALFRLELSRYTYFEAKPIVKILMGLILVGIMVASYLIAPNLNGLVMFPMFITLFLLIFVVVSSLNINTFDTVKGTLVWWLSYPYDRRILSFTRIAAIWITALKYMLMIWTAYWLGFIAAWLIQSIEMSIVISVFQWFLFTTVLFGFAFIVILGILQIGYFFMKSIALALLTAPLYFGAIYAPVMMMNTFYPDSFYNVTPNWTLLGITLIVGIILAVLGLWFGSKYLYLLINDQNSAAKSK